MTKKIISEYFGKLRKFGYKVFNFNSRKAFFQGLTGMTDFIIIGKGKIFFVELKIGKDKYSEIQIEIKKEILNVSDRNPFIFYLTATDLNYTEIVSDIMQENFKKLKTKYN